MNEQTLITLPSDALETYITAWLHAKEGLTGSQRTRTTYTQLLTDFRATLQQGGLDLASPAHLVALAAQGWAAQTRRQSSKPVSNATYNLRLAAISSFYRYLMRHAPDWEGDNPIERVERRRVQEYAQARALSATEVKKRLREIDRSRKSGLRDYALFLLAFTTGRRAAELMQLTWGDVEIVGERLRLTFQRAKGGKVLRDLVTQEASQALLTWLTRHYGSVETLDASAPLWPTLAHNAKRPALDYARLARRAKRVLGTSKVHATRHTFAHEMERAGARVSEIAARLGQSNPSVTGRYLQALRSDENPYADTLAGVFAGEEA